MFHHHDQFPEPTRPPNAPFKDLNFHEEPIILTPHQLHEDTHDQLDHHHHAAMSSSSCCCSSEDHDHKTPKGEKEAVDELLSILIDCLENELSTTSRALLLRKFLAEVEKEETLQTYIVERFEQSKFASTLTELYKSMPEPNMDQAGATSMKNVAESSEKFTEKLERFKVRILDFEEDQENKLERFKVRILDFDDDDEEAKPAK